MFFLKSLWKSGFVTEANIGETYGGLVSEAPFLRKVVPTSNIPKILIATPPIDEKALYLQRCFH